MLKQAFAPSPEGKRRGKAARRICAVILSALLLPALPRAAAEPFVFRSGVRFEMSPEQVQALEDGKAREQVPSLFTLSWGRLEYTGVELYGRPEASLVYIFDEKTRSRLTEILVMFPSSSADLEETFQALAKELTGRFGPAQVETDGSEGLPGSTPTFRAMGLPLFRKTGAAVVRLCQWLIRTEEGFAAADLYACRDTFGVWQVRLGFALLTDPQAEADLRYLDRQKGKT